MKNNMKHFFIVFFVILNLSNLHSQDLNNLDKKFGFNKFKLESSFSLYEKQLKFKLTGYDKVNYYDYTGNDIGLVFGCIVKRINLGFYNQKLYTISIDFISNTSGDDMRIQSELKDLFGYQDISYSARSSDTEYEWAISWKTAKTYLQANKISCTDKNNPCEVEIFLFSQKLRNEVKNNQF
jgi:hypothetical protein